MISGVQKALISGWYPVVDMRLLDSVKICLFSVIFKLFTLWRLSADIWLIQIYPANIFNILLKSVRYLIEGWSIFSWYYYTSDIQLISSMSWYPVYTFPARCYSLIYSTLLAIRFCWLCVLKVDSILKCVANIPTIFKESYKASKLRHDLLLKTHVSLLSLYFSWFYRSVSFRLWASLALRSLCLTYFCQSLGPGVSCVLNKSLGS